MQCPKSHGPGRRRRASCISSPAEGGIKLHWHRRRRESKITTKTLKYKHKNIFSMRVKVSDSSDGVPRSAMPCHAVRLARGPHGAPAGGADIANHCDL